MAYDTAPRDLEIKAPAAMLAPRPNTSVPDGGVVDVEPAGVVECLGAVTGVVDESGDEIVPGAFRRTLRTRQPKIIVAHDWTRLAGKVLDVEEWMPGDARLPRRTPNGEPWPPEAGALWLRVQYLLGTKDGRDQYEIAKAFGAAMAFSIGYKVKHARQRGGVRLFDDLELFEVSGVLHGANTLARLTSVKGDRPAGLEYKRVPATTPAIGGHGRTGGGQNRAVIYRCAVCDQPAAAIPGGLPADRSVICAECVEVVDRLDDPTPMTSTEAYDAAQRNETELYARPDGSLSQHPDSQRVKRTRETRVC